MWFIYNVSIEGIINGDGKNLKVDVMKSSEFEVQTTMRESNVRTESKVHVRVKTHFQNSKFLESIEVPAKESVCIFQNLVSITSHYHTSFLLEKYKNIKRG